MVTIVLVLAGCDPGPVPLTGKTELVHGDLEDEVVLTFETEPGAVLGFGYSGGPSDTPDVTADADGHAVFRIPMSKVGSHGNPYAWDVTARVGDRESDWYAVHLEPAFRLDEDGTSANCFAIGTECYVRVDLDAVSLASAAVGDELTVAGQEATANDNGEASVKVDFWPYVGDLSLADILRGDGDTPTAAIPIGLRYEYAGTKGEITGEARAKRIDLYWATGKHYEAIAAGPVDPGLAATGDGLVIAGLDHGPKLVGEAVHPSDVRYVALVKSDTRDVGSCGTYTRKDGSDPVEVRRYASDLHATVYDRVTGASLGDKVQRGSAPDCSYMANGDAGLFVGDDDTDALERWVAGWYAKRK
jgi:hypothetical protein